MIAWWCFWHFYGCPRSYSGYLLFASVKMKSDLSSDLYYLVVKVEESSNLPKIDYVSKVDGVARVAFLS